MKKCPFCNAELEDSVRFCRNCGTAQPGPDYLTSASDYLTHAEVPVEPEINPYDHTGEYECSDIAQNKLYAMLVYLLGLVGIVMAMLAAKSSDYASFHIRQGLKLTVVDAVVILFTAVLCWTVIVPVAALVLLAALAVLRFVCFVWVCQGKAVEVPIVRSLGFLK